jgi:signal peptidase II
MAADATGRLRLGLGIALVVLALDQALKAVMLHLVFDLPPPITPASWHPPIEVTGFFNLVMVWNRGISFGLLDGGGAWMPWVLALIALGVVAGLIVWLRRVDRGYLAVAIGLVIGGAIGNLIDRLRFGAVADFLDFHLWGYHWYAFNIADSAIVIGVIVLLVDGLVARPQGEAPPQAQTQAPTPPQPARQAGSHEGSPSDEHVS